MSCRITSSDVAGIPFLTTRQAALELQVSERTVRRWIQCGELAAHQFGPLIRISREDFDAFLKVRRCRKLARNPRDLC